MLIELLFGGRHEDWIGFRARENQILWPLIGRASRLPQYIVVVQARTEYSPTLLQPVAVLSPAHTKPDRLKPVLLSMPDTPQQNTNSPHPATPAGGWTCFSPQRVPELSRTRIQELIREGNVRVDGSIAKAFASCLRGGSH